MSQDLPRVHAIAAEASYFEGLVDELPGVEVEAKLSLPPQTDAQCLLETLARKFSHGPDRIAL